VEHGTREILDWHERREAADAARSLAEQSERQRAAALERLWRELPHLAANDRARIDAMSRDLAARLLREPLERLGRDADGAHERAARELFGL
jgi:glutamyl-tRNA reductase